MDFEFDIEGGAFYRDGDAYFIVPTTTTEEGDDFSADWPEGWTEIGWTTA